MAAIKRELQFPLAALLCLGACAKHSSAPAPKVAGAQAQASEELANFDRKREADVAAAARDETELQRIESLVHDGAARAGVYAAPSEAELMGQYDRFISGLPPTEFHVAHILVPTERMAQVLIRQLQAGRDFATLASEESTEESGVKGGDIGWIGPEKMPHAFTEAARQLRPGEFTQRPVHTIYGWHVIKLLETRSSAVPPYNQLKSQLAIDIQQQRYEKYLASTLGRTVTAPSNLHQ